MSRAELKPVPSQFLTVRGNRIGRLVGWSAHGAPLVDFPANPHGPRPARATIPIPSASREAPREVLLTFDEERSDRPIVIGLLEPETTDHAATPSLGVTKLHAVVDGKRAVIEGQDEIVLKCGLASITLRRNGRVVVRGTYVETRAEGINRVRGAAVEIN